MEKMKRHLISTVAKEKPWQGHRHITWWIFWIELVIAFALADCAMVAWAAHWLSSTQLAAYTLTYILLASGVLFTIYTLE